jgi:Domain of unknown function (DUF5916)
VLRTTALGVAIAWAPLLAQTVHPTPPPVVQAVRVTGEITLDGKLDEPAWQAAIPATTFQQTQPAEGPPGTQRTEVRFLYDDDALYIGARMYDSLGERGVHTRLARRDDQLDPDCGPPSPITSDKLTITLDPYHDHLTRDVFEVNPSGVIGDEYAVGANCLDPSWDPIWQVATRIDSLGWTAEIRIPFSQLRFSRDSEQTWGLQIVRVIDRLNERDQWAFYRHNEASGASRFGHLTALVIRHRPRQLELLPYTLAQEEATGLNRGNPIDPVNRQSYRAGGDIKYLLTSSLTLDATINPDFGQVDLDPAVINLSPFETFYPEKRPFFVSGANAFDYGNFNCMFCSNAEPMSLFYSRRIGRAPQLAGTIIDESSTLYYSVPSNTQIVGAAKITGRTHDGYSIGVLDALTNEESAHFVGTPTDPNEIWRTIVEPMSNYFVGRIKKDFREGQTVVGAMFTSTIRRLDTDTLRDSLHTHAEAGGLDFLHTWDHRNYSLMGSAAVTDVAGSPTAIEHTMQSSAHYFQRPDRKNLVGGLFDNRYDTLATSLRGWGSYLRLGKDNGDWLWEVAGNARSPGFEVNDLAYQRRADYDWWSTNIARQWTHPHTWYRNIFVEIGTQRQYDFDGDLNALQYQAFGAIDLPNFWHVQGFVIHRPTTLSDQIARGGPVFESRGIDDYDIFVGTDNRKPIVVTAGVEHSYGLDAPEREWTPAVTLLIKPASNLTLSLGPTLDVYWINNQYDTVLTAAPGDAKSARVFYGDRYIFSALHQMTLSMDTRVNVTFTPTLSLQVYAQPLLGVGHYYDFSEFDHRRQLAMTVDPSTLLANGTVQIDPVGGNATYQIENPDFDTRMLRGNAVLRWEYLRGSTIYLVWQQTRSNTNLYSSYADFALNRGSNELFRSIPDDIFIIKFSYWVGR